MAFELPKLPYAYDALEPHIDARTMEIHHGKHHQTYINNLNNALEGNEQLLASSIEELIISPVAGSAGIWPEINKVLFAFVAWLYGPIGAGAFMVLTISFFMIVWF